MLEAHPTDVVVLDEGRVAPHRAVTTPTESAPSAPQLIAVPPEIPLPMPEQSFT